MSKHADLRRALRSDSGAVALIVAIAIGVLLGVAALAVDMGALYAHRRQMQTAADAAALAGVQALPLRPDIALDLAAEYAALNTAEADETTFTVTRTNADNDTITAQVRDSGMGLFFARFLSSRRTEAPVGASAVAMVGSPTTYGSGLMPFGIIANGTTAAPYGYSPGGVIPLVVDNGAQSQGNWHYVDLTPYTQGASNTKQVIANGGTTEPVSIGTIINTQTGSPNNPNYAELVKYFKKTCGAHGLDKLVYDEERGIWEPTHESDGSHCNRLITCPVITIANGDPYNWDSVTGSEAVRIVGFINMFISNNPEFKEGKLLSEFVQVVPVDAFTPGTFVDYAGIITWLER